MDEEINVIGACVQKLYDTGVQGDTKALRLAQELFLVGIGIARKKIRASADTDTRKLKITIKEIIS